MKLIDLLVQELPKRGGWPEGAIKMIQDYDGELWFWPNDNRNCVRRFGRISEVADNHRKRAETENSGCFVTREQYEAELAAAQQPAWSGEGLPPVGTVCEWFDSSSKDGWTKVKVMYLSKWVIVLQSIESNFGHGVDVALDLVLDKVQEFRPIRTEIDEMVKLSGISVGAGYRK